MLLLGLSLIFIIYLTLHSQPEESMLMNNSLNELGVVPSNELNIVAALAPIGNKHAGESQACIQVNCLKVVEGGFRTDPGNVAPISQCLNMFNNTAQQDCLASVPKNSTALASNVTDCGLCNSCYSGTMPDASVCGKFAMSDAKMGDMPVQISSHYNSTTGKIEWKKIDWKHIDWNPPPPTTQPPQPVPDNNSKSHETHKKGHKDDHKDHKKTIRTP
eukprot:UN29116